MRIEEIQTLYAHPGKVQLLSFEPVSSYLVSSATDGLIQTWEKTRGYKWKEGSSINCNPCMVTSMAIMDSEVWIADHESPNIGTLQIRLLDEEACRIPIVSCLEMSSAGVNIGAVAVNQEADYIAYGIGSSCLLEFFTYNTWKDTVYKAKNGDIDSLLFQRDSKRLIAHTTAKDTLIFNTGAIQSEQPSLKLISTISGFQKICFEPQTGIIALGNENKIGFFASANGHELSSISLGQLATLNALILNKNGILVSGHDDGSVNLWDTHNGSRIETFKLHKNAVNCLAFISERKNIFASGSYGEIKILKINRTTRPKPSEAVTSHNTSREATVESHLKAKIKDLRDSLKKEQKALKVEREARETTERGREKLQRENAALQVSLKKQKQEFSRQLASQKASFEDSLARLQHHLVQLEERLEHEQDAKNEALDQLQQEDKDLRDAFTRIKSLQNEVSRLKQQLAAASTEKARISQQVDTVKHEKLEILEAMKVINRETENEIERIQRLDYLDDKAKRQMIQNVIRRGERMKDDLMPPEEEHYG